MSMSPHLILLPILLPFLTGVACLLLPAAGRGRSVLFVTGLALTFLSSLVVLRSLSATGYLAVAVGGWAPPIGIVLVADWTSGLLVAVSSFLGLAVGLYSLAETPAFLKRRYYFSLFLILLTGVHGAFLTGDLFNLYVWFEVLLIASFVLLTLGGDRNALEGGFKYLIMNLLASALFLAGAGFLYAKTGTLNMADLALRLEAHPDAEIVRSTSVLFLLAFGIKAAIFPLYFWLPASYHTPTVATSAIFAGLLTKVGVYALLRSYTLFLADTFTDTQPMLLWLAALTMLSGVFGAAAQQTLRKILSFHIVSQIGYMLMGLALMSPLGLAGTVFYLLHHIVVKTNLFLIAGIVRGTTGTEDLKKLGALIVNMPWLAVLFFIPAFSLGGIPPLSGFWAKFSLLLAAFAEEYYWLAACALLTGILTLYSMTKIWAEAFLKPAPQTLARAAIPLTPPHKLLLYGPVVAMALVTLGLGLTGAPVFSLAEKASAQLLDRRSYIQAVGLRSAEPLSLSAQHR